MTQIETQEDRKKRIRRENKEAREKRRRERIEAELVDRAYAIVALRKVRDDENSSPAQRLEAVRMISRICGYNPTTSSLSRTQRTPTRT